MTDKHSQNGQTPANEQELQAAKVTAYALGQLTEAEAAQVEQWLSMPANDDLRQQFAQVRELETALDSLPQPRDIVASAALRKAVEQKLESVTPQAADRSVYRTRILLGVVGSVCVAVLLVVLFSPAVQQAREAARRPMESSAKSAPNVSWKAADDNASAVERSQFNDERKRLQEQQSRMVQEVRATLHSAREQMDSDPTGTIAGLKLTLEDIEQRNDLPTEERADLRERVDRALKAARRKESEVAEVGARAKEQEGFSREKDSERQTVQPRRFALSADRSVPASETGLSSSAAKKNMLGSEAKPLTLQVTPRMVIQEEEHENLGLATIEEDKQRIQPSLHRPENRSSNEQYELPPENPFRSVAEAPLSTFSIDVDTASYANVRRFLNSGRLPPPAAVRIEELLNYFSYSYPQPAGDEPFSVNLESAECPWQPGHLLLRVGLKGKDVHRAERPSSNLVFLIDVSGSMADENKLPLLKTSLAMMAAELKHSDRVSIVVYAGDAGTKLDSARGDEREKISNVIGSLHAGGSTHGSAGIQLAYDLAKKNFIAGGVNRVIWATDGDLNVGVTDDNSLVTLIKEKAASGVFLTVLGVGEGNLKDAKLEKLADNGNGIYAYLDGIKEARKVLIEQMSGSLVTIAKDVKLQIEFNPVEVASYRLIGYENRMLAARDFADDKKDAGEIGAGHTVTALYELVPAGRAGEKQQPPESELKYQKPVKAAVEEKVPPSDLSDAAKSGELLTLKLRYKQPEADASVLREFPLKERGGRFNSASSDFQFAAGVAQFGMLLRGSQHRGSSAYSAVAETAAATIGSDAQGLRAEFVDLVRKAERLAPR